MNYLFAFIILSIPLILLSRKSLKTRGNHGYYRFFSWEAILILLVFKVKYWFVNPLSWHQIISWILLFTSVYFVLAGVITLKRKGKQQNIRLEENLYAFEKTSKLVTSGIYKYIRHPLYSSLLLLAWGIYLKKPDWIFIIISIFASLFLFLTARADEKECTDYFGNEYKNYIKSSKRFIPLLF